MILDLYYHYSVPYFTAYYILLCIIVFYVLSLFGLILELTPIHIYAILMKTFAKSVQNIGIC